MDLRGKRSCLDTSKKDKVVNLITFQLRDSLFFVSTNFIWHEKFDSGSFFSLNIHKNGYWAQLKDFLFVWIFFFEILGCFGVISVSKCQSPKQTLTNHLKNRTCTSDKVATV